MGGGNFNSFHNLKSLVDNIDHKFISIFINLQIYSNF